MNIIGQINNMHTAISSKRISSGKINFQRNGVQRFVVQSINTKRILFLTMLVCTLMAGFVSAEEASVVKKYSAVAKKSIDFGVGAQKPKIEFKFDNGSAWLRESGAFSVEAEIKHGSLLCGTYEVGVRFGIGKPACTNVSWLSETQYVTRRKQCNHAWMAHQGTGKDLDLVGDVDLVTCGQLVIKCTGKCKNF